MIDRLRTILAWSIAKRVTNPRALIISAWLWLAAKSEDTEEKRRCLNAVLQPEPENEPATWALLLFDQRRPSSLARNEGGPSIQEENAAEADHPGWRVGVQSRDAKAGR